MEGLYTQYSNSGDVEIKGSFWRDSAIGPSYYFKDGKLFRYNERDYSGEVYYVKLFADNKTIKEEGLAISPNIYLDYYSDTIPLHQKFTAYFFYAEPDGYVNEMKAFFDGEQVLFSRKSYHIGEIEKKVDEVGQHEIKVVSTLKFENNIKYVDSSILYFVTLKK